MLRNLCKLLACLILLVSTAQAMGKVALKVDIGWNGAFRAGRWAPVYITAADDMANPARNVIVTIVAPHDKTFALRINTFAAIRPDPTTLLVYVPLTNQLDETAAIITDPANGKKLAEVAFQYKPGSIWQTSLLRQRRRRDSAGGQRHRAARTGRSEGAV
jgi:hypothetical protein